MPLLCQCLAKVLQRTPPAPVNTTTLLISFIILITTHTARVRTQMYKNILRVRTLFYVIFFKNPHSNSTLMPIL